MVKVGKITICQGLLGISDSDRCVGGDLLCQFHNCRHKFFLRAHTVYKTDPVCFVCFDIDSSIYHFLCFSGSNQSCETLRSTESRSDAKTNLRLSEHSVFGAVTDITAHCKFISTAKRETVDSCDRRDRKCLQLTENIVSSFTELTCLLYSHCAHCSDICAGNKGFLTRAGHNQHSCCTKIDAVKNSV